MRAKLDASVLQEAIRVASRLSPPFSGNVTFLADGAKLYMHSAGTVSRCSILLPCEVTGKAFFAVGIEAIRDATKGRNSISLTYDKTMLSVKSGNYSASLVTVDAIAMQEEKEEKGTEWKLSVEQAQWLKDAVSKVTLKLTAINDYMPVSVKLTDKGAFVSCYDNEHMAFLSDKEITGNLDVTLPIETFNLVLDTFNKLPFKMTVTQSSLLVKNKLVDVVLSLPASDEESSESHIATEAVIAKARSTSKADGTTIEVSKAELVSFLENARAVATKERSEIRMSTNKGELLLAVKTTNGVAKSTVKASVKAAKKFNLDYEFFAEAISKCSDTVVMKVVDDGFVSFALKGATIVVSLNQED